MGVVVEIGESMIPAASALRLTVSNVEADSPANTFLTRRNSSPLSLPPLGIDCVRKPCMSVSMLPVLMRAADLWAEARRLGHPRNDADIIIAATALEEGRQSAARSRRR